MHCQERAEQVEGAVGKGNQSAQGKLFKYSNTNVIDYVSLLLFPQNKQGCHFSGSSDALDLACALAHQICSGKG